MIYGVPYQRPCTIIYVCCTHAASLFACHLSYYILLCLTSIEDAASICRATETAGNGEGQYIRISQLNEVILFFCTAVAQ